MFELHLASLPTEEAQFDDALARAVRGVERLSGWGFVRTMTSPVRGAQGSREWLLHAVRSA